MRFDKTRERERYYVETNLDGCEDIDRYVVFKLKAK